MNNVKTIREFFGLSQKSLGVAIGCTQGNIGHYETGESNLPTGRAIKIKTYAAKRGLNLSLDQIHGMAPLPKRVITASEQPVATKEP